ncbi:hypothetical protein GCM10023214_62560 [Amycolatopsis dongchuanensis]|uniref:Uncharacterized protein n=1 Tax=Amycolatopsis dongchuanensis TaxID=1070866 RepID=A0ABP8VEB0_9PSEU
MLGPYLSVGEHGQAGRGEKVQFGQIDDKQIQRAAQAAAEHVGQPRRGQQIQLTPRSDDRGATAGPLHTQSQR